MDFNDFIYFVLEKNSNPSYSFNGYYDLASGQEKFIFKGRTARNGTVEVPHRFKFDRAHRSIRVHKNEVDKYGNSVAEFLRGFPECKDSPNGSYNTDANGKKTQSGVWFKEVKEHADAVTAIEAKQVKLAAENVAIALKGSDLRDMAVLFNCLHDDESITQHKVLEYAGSDPSKFMEFYNSPTRAAKSLLLKAVKAGEVSVKGTIYIWKEQTLGVSEDFAVAKLTSDEELAQALIENLKIKGIS